MPPTITEMSAVLDRILFAPVSGYGGVGVWGCGCGLGPQLSPILPYPHTPILALLLLHLIRPLQNDAGEVGGRDAGRLPGLGTVAVVGVAAPADEPPYARQVRLLLEHVEGA